MTENAPVSAKSGATRRSVLRVGANAAWAVPAVSLATAVPAFAAVSPDAKVTASGAQINKLGNLFTGTIILANEGVKPTGQVTVVFSNLRVQRKPGGPFVPFKPDAATWATVGLNFVGITLSSKTATTSSLAGIPAGSNTTLTFTIVPDLGEVLGGLLGGGAAGVSVDYAVSVPAPGVSVAAGTITG
ncbi:hypothetical protein [Nocardioides sp.]|uniref:hypothetical protein n=1 Tax=Nocardioides sp. TaxID=35761 RepID=UPI003518C515